MEKECFGAAKNESVFLVNPDSVVRHLAVTGGSGSGKTTMARKMMEQQISLGGGLVVMGDDGSCLRSLYRAAENCNRQNDILVIGQNSTELDFFDLSNAVKTNRIVFLTTPLFLNDAETIRIGSDFLCNAEQSFLKLQAEEKSALPFLFFIDEAGEYAEIARTQSFNKSAILANIGLISIHKSIKNPHATHVRVCWDVQGKQSLAA